MKKVLMVLGIIFLVVIVGFVALLIWAQKSGSGLQEKFFLAVLSGEPNQVTAMLDPSAQKEVDEPVLAAWMQAVKTNLGGFKGLSKTNFNTSVNYKDGAKITESIGTVEFEKGDANSELVFRDDRIVKFLIVSKALPDDWFKGPVSTDLYRRKGKEFLTYVLENEPQKAFDMMHEALQTELPLDALKNWMPSRSSLRAFRNRWASLYPSNASRMTSRPKASNRC